MLINADCSEYLKTLSDGSIDLTVTSPPYDNLRTYNGSYIFDFHGIAKELFRVTNKGGVVVWIVGDATINGSETGTSFKQALAFKEIGFNLHDTMIYAKKNFPPLTHKRYEQQFEYMFILAKGTIKTFNGIQTESLKVTGGGKFYEKDGSVRNSHSPKTFKDTKLQTNIWYYSTGQSRNGHPAVFPLQLAKDHIISWSNENDIVLDPFMGSGTTCLAAKQLNRKFIGIEKEQEYFEIAKARVSM